MNIKGLVNVSYYLDNWIPKILIVTRNDEGKKIVEEIKDWKPYIYIEEKYQVDLEAQFNKDIISIEPESKEHIIDKTKKLLKVTLRNPLCIFKIKEAIKCEEADIPFTNKWLIDNVDRLEAGTKYRINYLDIETTSIKGFPNYLNAVENIISLACYDNFLDKSFLWIYHEKYKDEIIEQTVEEGKLEIRRFNTEKDMLNNYLDFMVETKPDFITSWNVSFDIPYLIARLDKLELQSKKLSPFYGTRYAEKFYNGLVSWANGPGVYGKRFGTTEVAKHPEIKGLYYFDMLTAYKNITAKEQESFKLDYIAQKELGINKLRTHFDIGTEWLNNPEFIEQYNYIDVYLIKKLDEKMKIINRYTIIRDKSYLCCLTDVFSTGRVLDSYILKKYKDKFIFPSKVYDMSLDKRIAGGVVRLPVANLYKNIAVFDFSGFYPSLMTTFNLSSEKLIKEDVQIFDPEIEETVGVESILPEKMYDYDEDKKEIIYKIRTPKFSADLTYNLDEPGVLTTAVKDLIVLRTEAKKEMKKYKYGSVEYEQAYNNQFSYKFLINGIYGACAYAGFRLFKLHNANAITAFARMLSKWVEYKLRLQGWQTIAGDTDSLFVQLKDSEANLQDNLKEVNELLTPIVNTAIIEFANKYLPQEFAEKHTLKMDMEKIYKTFLLPDVKKRYIGLLKYYDGEAVEKMHYMGLDAKKSNTIKISKEAQLELAEVILREGDIKVVFDKYYKMLKKNEDIDMFKIPSKLEQSQDSYKTKTPAVKASLWSNQHLGTKFRAGNKFYLVYVTGLDTESVAFEDKNQLLKITKLQLNKDKYIEDLYNKFDNLIGGVPKFKQIHEESYMRNKNNQSLLGDYFK